MNPDLYGLGNVELWALVSGILLPLLIAAVTRATWSSRLKTVVMLGAVFLVTVIGELVAGRVGTADGWRGWLSTLMVIFLMTVTSYRHIWKPTNIAPAIEAATTPKRGFVDDDEDGLPD